VWTALALFTVDLVRHSRRASPLAVTEPA
jgi:hypothetical protein